MTDRAEKVQAKTIALGKLPEAQPWTWDVALPLTLDFKKLATRILAAGFLPDTLQVWEPVPGPAAISGLGRLVHNLD